MMFKQIDCPHCGNETTVSSKTETQFCKYCKRRFNVKITVKNKEGKKPKFIWEVTPEEYVLAENRN